MVESLEVFIICTIETNNYNKEITEINVRFNFKNVFFSRYNAILFMH